MAQHAPLPTLKNGHGKQNACSIASMQKKQMAAPEGFGTNGNLAESIVEKKKKRESNHLPPIGSCESQGTSLFEHPWKAPIIIQAT
mmetsp:Transcript_29257/g.70587  ORF Transcript_29257/g.70587 Transcript_29257/m.70587 type:complete len:86 (-) Transcript_29257:40-297(-)